MCDKTLKKYWKGLNFANVDAVNWLRKGLEKLDCSVWTGYHSVSLSHKALVPGGPNWPSLIKAWMFIFPLRNSFNWTCNVQSEALTTCHDSVIAGGARGIITARWNRKLVTGLPCCRRSHNAKVAAVSTYQLPSSRDSQFGQQTNACWEEVSGKGLWHLISPGEGGFLCNAAKGPSRTFLPPRIEIKFQDSFKLSSGVRYAASGDAFQ